MRKYRNGEEYPYEGFIQKSIAQYFKSEGFKIDESGQVDLIAEKTMNNEKWIIEAKGMTSSVGLDFNTCIGQLIKSIATDQVYYAIAIPKEEKYKLQCRKLSEYVRVKLNLYIIFVDMNGKIEFVAPSENTI